MQAIFCWFYVLLLISTTVNVLRDVDFVTLFHHIQWYSLPFLRVVEPGFLPKGEIQKEHEKCLFVQAIKAIKMFLFQNRTPHISNHCN